MAQLRPPPGVRGSGEIHMQSERKERNILIGLLAILSVFVFFLGWYTAALFDPDWVFGANYLSDLGVSDVEESRLFFNEGCLIGGILLFFFGAVVLASDKGLSGSAGGLAAAVAGIFMAMVGLFPSDQGDIHLYSALAAFGIGFLALAAFAAKDWKNGLRTLSALTIVAFVMTVLAYLMIMGLEIFDLYTIEPLITSEVFIDVPGIETLAALVLFTLMLIQGMKFLYRGASARKTPDGKGISDRHRVAYGFAAMLAMVSFLLFWLFSMLSDTSWVFGTDRAYILGLSPIEQASWTFALACIVGGFFTLLYGIGSGMMTGANPCRGYAGFFITVVGAVMVLMGIAYIAAGEMLEDAEWYVIIVGALGILCMTVSDWINKRMMTASLYLVLLFSIAAAMLLFEYTSLVSYSILIFFLILGIEGARLMVGAERPA